MLYVAIFHLPHLLFLSSPPSPTLLPTISPPPLTELDCIIALSLWFVYSYSLSPSICSSSSFFARDGALSIHLFSSASGFAIIFLPSSYIVLMVYSWYSMWRRLSLSFIIAVVSLSSLFSWSIWLHLLCVCTLSFYAMLGMNEWVIVTWWSSIHVYTVSHF